MSNYVAALVVIWIALFGLITVVLLGVVAVALVKLNSKLETITNMAEPVVNKASDTLDSVQRVTASVGEKADVILTRGVALTDSVSGNVEKTAAVVQQTVTTPLIKLSSVIAGVSKGMSFYVGTSRGNGRNDSSDSKE
jgi:hypothetical protein